MSKTISMHSFRGGTGKSNLTANVACAAAQRGKRVGVIDTDVQSPGIHVLFGLGDGDVKRTLNDYLWGLCPIEETATDVTPEEVRPTGGSIRLIPSSLSPGEIARVLRDGYDVGRLIDGIHALNDRLGLDCLFIDTHPGLNEETLLSITISDVLGVVLRPDSQDYQGTAVTVELGRKLDVPELLLIVNKVPAAFDPVAIAAKVASTYDAEVIGTLPSCDEMMQLASSDLFILRHPDHPLTRQIREISDRLTGPSPRRAEAKLL
jgi:MinD-like ATPase involved in chromosome partitioning or flagellar assembly